MAALADRAIAYTGQPLLRTAAGTAVTAAILPLVVTLDIPLARELVAFVALFLLPGALLLRLLQARDLDAWEFLVYAAGLSLAVVMALGLAVNGLHGLGLARPISSIPMTIAVSIVIALLAAVALWRWEPVAIRLPLGELLKPYTLLPLLPVALVVLGTQLANTRQDNTVLLVAIGLVAMLPVAAFVPRLLPEKAYPLAVVAMGLALLLHRSLISDRFTGFDIHQEYYFANLVLSDGVWDTAISHPYNFTLSIVMVAPIFSAVADVEILWVFKAVYPLLFSLMPLALFLAYRGMVGPKVAFLGATFFVATQPFFQLMPHMARMQIGLLFLALLLLTLRRGGVPQPVPMILGAGVIVAHYAVAYSFIPILAVALGVMLVRRALDSRLTKGFGRDFPEESDDSAVGSRFLRPNFANLFVALAFVWFAYVSAQALLFDSAVESVRFFTEQLPRGFGEEASQGLYLASASLTPLREAARMLHFTLQFFMAVGILIALLRWRRSPFGPEFVALASAGLVFSGALIIVPFFAGSLGISRWYITLLPFLAPFAIVGGLAVFQGLTSVLLLCLRALSRRPLTLKSPSIAMAVLPLLAAGLSLYLLFNTGFVYELVQERPNAVPFSRQWMLANGNTDEKLGFLAAYPTDEDYAGAQWLVANRDVRTPVLGDLDARIGILSEWIPYKDTEALFPDTTFDDDAYIFLRYLNTRDGVVSSLYFPGSPQWWPLAQLEPQLQATNVIYTNGSSRVYMTRPGITSIAQEAPFLE